MPTGQGTHKWFNMSSPKTVTDVCNKPSNVCLSQHLHLKFTLRVKRSFVLKKTRFKAAIIQSIKQAGLCRGWSKNSDDTSIYVRVKCVNGGVKGNPTSVCWWLTLLPLTTQFFFFCLFKNKVDSRNANTKCFKYTKHENGEYATQIASV